MAPRVSLRCKKIAGVAIIINLQFGKRYDKVHSSSRQPICISSLLWSTPDAGNVYYSVKWQSDECRIITYFELSNCSLIEAVTRNFLGGAEDNYENSLTENRAQYPPE
jgi:hypothetical protein